MNTVPITPPELLFGFVFLYPLFMAYLWMAGGLFYWFHYERGPRRQTKIELLKQRHMRGSIAFRAGDS